MASSMSEKHLTTGDVSRLLKMCQQTVIRCFDNGTLKGYRVPGSRFRRIPPKHLIRFIYEQMEGYPREEMRRIWSWLETKGMLDDLNEQTWNQFAAAGRLGEISPTLRAKLLGMGIPVPEPTKDDSDDSEEE